uniref:hypothetical protein n=1 Tax=Phytoactinopolyspora endophytica TaxID=1642495 RepID=UPI0013EC4D12
MRVTKAVAVVAIGLATVLVAALGGLTPAFAATTSAFSSDDFESGGLNTALWTVTDPAGDGDVSVSDGLLHLAVPASTNYDIWNTNRSLRVTQP